MKGLDKLVIEAVEHGILAGDLMKAIKYEEAMRSVRTRERTRSKLRTSKRRKATLVTRVLHHAAP